MSDQIEPTQAAEVGTGLLTNPAAEFQAFKAWWKRTIPAKPIPSPASYIFDAWMASARHRQSEYARGLEDAAKVAEDFIDGDQRVGLDCAVTGRSRRIATAIRNLKAQPR